MFSGAAATSGTTSWASMIGPGSSGNYVSDAHVFQSPFDTRAYNATNLSYGMNAQIVPTPPSDTLGNPVKTVTSYTHPSALMVVGPSETLAGSSLKFQGTMTSTSTIAPNSGIVGLIGNHTLLNILYGDWHVATININTFNSASATGQFLDPVSTATQ
jgi:prepilin-type processing-associated H-X9-DG protein